MNSCLANVVIKIIEAHYYFLDYTHNQALNIWIDKSNSKKLLKLVKNNRFLKWDNKFYHCHNGKAPKDYISQEYQDYDLFQFFQVCKHSVVDCKHCLFNYHYKHKPPMELNSQRLEIVW